MIRPAVWRVAAAHLVRSSLWAGNNALGTLMQGVQMASAAVIDELAGYIRLHQASVASECACSGCVARREADRVAAKARAN